MWYLVALLSREDILVVVVVLKTEDVAVLWLNEKVGEPFYI